MKDETNEIEICSQCGKEAMPDEKFCWECIIDDAITMGVIDKDLNYL